MIRGPPSIQSESSSSSFRSSFSDIPFGYSVPNVYLQQKPRLVFVGDGSSAFVFEDLVRAPTELIGEGTFGSTYKAAMDNGFKIMVKELKSVSMSESKFARRMQTIGNVKHENVVPLKAYIYSKDEVLVFYDYYNHGSVSALLHGENQGKLDWKTRLRIALGVARGIAHIHSQRGKKLVHGNVKSSNVFLNSQRYVCVSDFGLTGIMIGAKFEHSTVGYHAPEVKGTKDTSQESDVYSFGILLLELLTGKSPVRISTSHKATDLVGWVNSFKRTDWALEVIDEDLIYGSRDVEQWLIQLLEIGITCVAKSPQKRPKMASVVEMMEDISPKNISIDISAIAKPKALVCLNISRIRRFDLEDLLRASAGKLGRGTIGSSYKARLESGIIVTVKRTRNVVVEKKEFDEHINVVGSIRHDNV